MPKTPASLLDRLRRPGDQDAWRRFVELYTPMIYHWARQAGLDETEATDLAQEVLLKLVQKLPEFQYDQTKSFRAWLKTVTLNRWRECMRRRRLEPTHLDAPGSVPQPDHVDPAAAFEEAEYRAQLVHQAMKLIQGDFETATWRMWWEYVVVGRPAVQVATQLGATVNAVYLAKSRVLRRLREELDGLLE